MVFRLEVLVIGPSRRERETGDCLSYLHVTESYASPLQLRDRRDQLLSFHGIE